MVLVLVGAPGGEHLLGERDAFLAEGLLLAEAVGVATEVTLEMRPAHLALVGVEMAVAVPAVRDDDPRILLPTSALNCSRLQCSAITKKPASGVVAVHRARPSPRVRQPVSSTCTASWSSTQSCNCRCGPASASEARWQIASTAPVESVTPNRSLRAPRRHGVRRGAGRSTSRTPPAVSDRTRSRRSRRAIGRWSAPDSADTAAGACDAPSRQR